LELLRKDHNFCHRCGGYTQEWKPMECIYCHKLSSFCNDCSEKLDDFGTFSKSGFFDDDDDDHFCGEPPSDDESSDEEPEESDDENN